jgi:TIR domain
MSINFVCPACYAKLNAPNKSASRKVKCPKPGCGEIILVPAAPLYDVFISYSSKDKALADAICSTLETEEIRCWIAPRDVLPGRPYAERLTDALNGSRIMVLVLSSHSNNSPHVLREIEQAVENRTPIIPFRIEDIRLAKALEYYLKPFHWLDAFTPPIEQHLGALSSAVEGLLSEGKPRRQEVAWAEELEDDVETEPERKGGFFSRMIKFVIFLLVVTVLGYCGYVYYSGSMKKREADSAEKKGDNDIAKNAPSDHGPIGSVPSKTNSDATSNGIGGTSAPPGKQSTGPTNPKAGETTPKGEKPNRYTGKAMSYSISLGSAWKKKDASTVPQADLYFDRSGLSLIVRAYEKDKYLKQTAADYVAKMQKMASTAGKPEYDMVRLVDKRSVRIKGSEWDEFTVDLRRDSVTLRQRIRYYFGKEGIFYLVATTRATESELDVEITQAFDSFEFPSAK